MFVCFFQSLYFFSPSITRIRSLTTHNSAPTQTGMLCCASSSFFPSSPLYDMAQCRWTKWLWQIGIGNDKMGYLISMVEGIGLCVGLTWISRLSELLLGLALMAAFIHLMWRSWQWKTEPSMLCMRACVHACVKLRVSFQCAEGWFWGNIKSVHNISLLQK